MAKGNGETLAIVLGCIDYRTQRPLDRFLRSIELRRAYDATLLPGASLAGTFRWPKETFADRWWMTVQDIIQASITLHSVQRLIIVDHLDCGAYRLAYSNGNSMPLEEEYLLHAQHLQEMRIATNRAHPELVVETYLMNVGGAVRPLMNSPEEQRTGRPDYGSLRRWEAHVTPIYAPRR